MGDKRQCPLQALWWLSFPKILLCSSQGPQASPAGVLKKAEYASCNLEGLEFPSSALIPKAVGKPAQSQHPPQTLHKSPG